MDVVSGDGSSTSLGSATADAGGAFEMDASGMSSGGYSVVATGNQGGQASGLLIVK